MAHYAFLDENNVVTEVIVGRNENEVVDGISNWEEYYGSIRNQRCLRTSYNGNIRYNFAGIGFVYDEVNDAFIEPRPYSSWILGPDFKWHAPVAIPKDSWSEENPNGIVYIWSDSSISWVPKVD